MEFFLWISFLQILIKVNFYRNRFENFRSLESYFAVPLKRLNLKVLDQQKQNTTYRTQNKMNAVACIPYSVLCVLYYLSCILYSVLCVLYYLSCILYSVLCVLYSVLCVLYFLSCILYSVFFILYSKHRAHKIQNTEYRTQKKEYRIQNT